MTQETKRQSIHIGLLAFAFGLRFLTRFQSVIALTILLILVIVIFPRLRIRRHLYRRAERRHSQGAILYVVMLLTLVIIFPPEVVAGSWAILALGDGMATLFGKNFRARPLPWNRDKTFAGTLAFWIFGTLGAMILMVWSIPGFTISAAFQIALRTAAVAAIVESLPWRLNDNMTVPVASALVLSYLL